LDTAKKAFTASLPVMAGYFVLGSAFGVLLSDKGYSFVWAFAMSLFIYAGSMQYVAISLLTGGASLISTALMTFMVNLRHLFYGISMLKKYSGTGKYRPYLIFSLTDETYALVVNGAPEGTDEHLYYFLLSLFDHCYWVAGSTIGGLIGAALTFDTTGIDFAMTALFVTIFLEQLLAAEDYFPAVTGVLATVLSLILFGPDAFLIPAMMLISVVLTIYGLFQMKRGKPAETDNPAAGREGEER
jgi:4-azaleucine resistance transporter AzlC